MSQRLEDGSGSEASGNRLLRAVGVVGSFVIAHAKSLCHLAAVVGTVLYTVVRPRFWTRQSCANVARQIRSVAVEPLGFVLALGVMVGISIVVQFTFWTGEAGQSQLLGPLLVTVVARELGPILIDLVVIVRSGSAMTTELGVLKIDGGVGVLESNGGDVFLDLVVPRVIGVALATFCLTIAFIIVAFASGYTFAAWTGRGSRDFLLFADTVSGAVQQKDVFNIVAKNLLPAFFASTSCCIGGLSVSGSYAEIPRAAQRALTRSITGILVTSAVVSMVTYF